MNSKLLYEAIGYVDDEYLDIADSYQKETKEMKQKHIYFARSKSSIRLVAAVISITLLATTALASNWIPGIFQALRELYPEDEKLFESAAEANTEVIPQTAVIPQMEMSEIVLYEQYYDGETVLLGYSLDAVLPKPILQYELDDALMQEIKTEYGFASTAWEKEEPWMSEPDTENSRKYGLDEDARMMDKMMKAFLPQETYEEMWLHMEEKGYACITTQDVWIGDHVLVNGHETSVVFDANENGFDGRMDYEVAQGSCIRLNPLPEACRDQESVTVTLDVQSCIQYWYIDLEGKACVHYGATKSEPVSFTLENMGK